MSQPDTPASTATPTPEPTATEVPAEATPTEEAAEAQESSQATTTEAAAGTDQSETDSPPPEEESTQTDQNNDLADVISVEASGQPGAYRFSVGIASPDTGCEQYADWWEVLSEEGELIYRRVLLHSHPSEQPFVRSGGPVDIPADEVVWVRAHMNPGGYGGAAFKGSVANGFEAAALEADFVPEVANQPPLPDGCAF